jgi:hypothetical protein
LDGKKEIILFGNNNYPRLKFGKFDANYGVVFTPLSKGVYEYVPQVESGLSVKGDVRDATFVQTSAGKVLFIGINNQELEAYLINHHQ